MAARYLSGDNVAARINGSRRCARNLVAPHTFTLASFRNAIAAPKAAGCRLASCVVSEPLCMTEALPLRPAVTRHAIR